MREPALPPAVRNEVPGWLAARRHGIPASMVAAVAERRAAGDWRGACAAGRMDVDVDLDAVANTHGRETADAVLDDLLHLVPDLIRWHLPRRGTGGTGLLEPQLNVWLNRYGFGAGASTLWVHTPVDLYGPQRLRLELATTPKGPASLVWGIGGRYRWDARRTGELLAHRFAGDRAPFFHRDGSPLRPDELPTTAPDRADPANRVALAEWITMLQDAGRVVDAWGAAGVDADFTVPAGGARVRIAGQQGAELTKLMPVLAARSRSGPIAALLGRYGAWENEPHVEVRIADGVARVGVVMWPSGRTPVVAEPGWRRSADVELLRMGRIGAAELHPLVRAGLFPEEPASARASGYAPATSPVPTEAPVRCGGQWHRVGFGPDGIAPLSHSADDVRRERTLRALGGRPAPCFAVVRDWPRPPGWLPRPLRRLRTRINLAVLHGDADDVERILAAGVDLVGFRTQGYGRTLLHRAAHLDRADLVRRLVDAGLDVEDNQPYLGTPLVVAASKGAPLAIIRALLEAGAVVGAGSLDRVVGPREDRATLLDLLIAARRRETERGR